MSATPFNPKKIPGRIVGARLVKSVRSKNQLRYPEPSWALSVPQLDAAQKQGVIEVLLTDKDSGISYSASLGRIRQEGRPIHYAGYEPQIALPLRLWHKAESAQPGLFEGVQP